jgi:hypothetical protein
MPLIFVKCKMDSEKKKKPLQTKPVTVTDVQRNQVNREFNTSFSGVQRTFASLREQSLKDKTKPLTLARHSTTQQRPEAMFDADGKLPSFQTVVSKEEATATVFKFEVGQRVSSLVKKAAFRGDASKAVFSERVYRISKITGARVSLETLSGEELSDMFAVYQLRPATGPDGGLAGDARAAARDKAADRRKGVARGKRAFAEKGIDPGDTLLGERWRHGDRGELPLLRLLERCVWPGSEIFS